MSLKERLSKVLEKIDNLSDKLELDEKEKKELIEDPIAEQVEALLEEQQPVPEEVEPAPGKAPEEVELEWEKISEIVGIRDVLHSLRSRLAEFCLNHEVQKRRFMNAMESTDRSLNQKIEIIRGEFGLSEEAIYELELPDPGDKSSGFLRLQK